MRNVKNAMVYTDEWVSYKQANHIYNYLFVKGEYVNVRIYPNTMRVFGLYSNTVSWVSITSCLANTFSVM